MESIVMSKDYQERLDLVANQIESIQNDLLRINAETLSYQTRLKLLEETDKRHQDELRSLNASQEVTKALVNQILSRFDSFEARVFGLFEKSQLNQSSERSNSQKEWIRFATFLVGGTVAAIIARLFFIN